mgnify:CR=1 FL=1
MKKSFVLSILVLFTCVLFSQEVKIDLDKIKKIAKSESYQQLMNRYQENDTTLNLEDYTNLYYGQAFQDSYNGYSSHDSLSILKKLLHVHKDSLDISRATACITKILFESPFEIQLMLTAAYLADKTNQPDLAKKWVYKYNMLINTLFNSGLGKSHETAVMVIKVPDEYAFVHAIGLQVESQALVNKDGKAYDLLKLVKNNLGIEELYFDISLFFGKLF